MPSIVSRQAYDVTLMAATILPLVPITKSFAF
jgi:hypothetical protein